MQYRPELDGVRAFAVLAVIASHTGDRITAGGWMGVDVFFVLSGYLITSILLVERTRTGSVSLSRFFTRRLLRLYPALLTTLLLGLAFYRELGHAGTLVGYAKTAAMSAFYVEDLVWGLAGQPYGGFGHTWSLAVEEQFYLAWAPLLAFLLTRRRNPLWVALGAAGASWVAMDIYLAQPGGGFDQAYYLPWTRVGTLLVGAALAVHLHRGGDANRLAHPAFGLTCAVTAVLLVWVAAYRSRTPNMWWEAPGIALTAAALLWHLSGNQPSLVRRLLTARPLTWIGRRSYGIYLFHAPVFEVLVLEVHISRLVDTVLMLGITLAIATLSYRFVEFPFLRLKSRFQPLDTSTGVSPEPRPAP